MFNIDKISESRVDIEIGGSLDADAMQAGLDQLIEASEGVEHGVMLYRIVGMTMPTFGALTVELQKLPELFGLLTKYDRCAVLSDQAWLRAAADIEGALIPGLAIKSFDLNEEAEAEAWLEAE